MTDEQKQHVTPDWCPDLEEYAKRAKTRRELAWDAIKRREDPAYVAARYGFPVETMRAAAAKLPPEKHARPTYGQSRFASDGGRESSMADLVSESLARREGVAREPGCDDEKD